MSVLEGLKPERVFYYFEEICKIPHGSGNTKEISDYLVKFAKDHNLSCVQDDSNNVIIRKPASEGYENSQTVILQGHMDMVCEKKDESSHDFEKDGLQLFIEDDFIRAKDTTLGGDDGIAVAYVLAILEDDTLEHPSLEVVLTVDEEIGLLGAGALDFGQLCGKTMINLDSEEEGIFYISCAGGMTSTSELSVRFQEGKGIPCEIQVKGLMGGHSGAEIHKNGANAHILMARIWFALKEEMLIQLASLNGGSKETAITRECGCTVLVNPEDVELLKSEVKRLEEEFRKEYAGIEEHLEISVTTKEATTASVVHPVDLEKIVFYLVNIPNGVQKMSGTFPGLVETSNNIGVLELTKDSLLASSAPRSSVASARDYISDKIGYLTELLGGEYTVSGIYPAWEYRADSRLQSVMSEVYEKMYGEKPSIQALHAGLECGIFFENIDNLDCVSMGPDIKGIHTVEERLSISSVQRNYEYLLEVLKELK
ncbi:MAG: aminoacyl-histidine dipeptidase [Eubacteriales bacterium]|nr:aminoacyl-histidine dipeptidase [Eubacteriales bacterium]